ncbi:CbtA family protein [Polaromonas jejuensis]|uniref:CbtA family protein n=1 Tax=Polaromonas jejuensis TaxID=457502 RepID=A0ABW0QGE4_9BURK|nr:CbtA family protein [Polaromonas jejuensis]
MIFQRLVWSALAAAVLVGGVQTGVQRWQAAPLILAAEVYEEQKAEAPEPVASLTGHVHAEGVAHGHEHEHEHGSAKEWEPENGAERIGWTLVANILHAFSMALLVFAVMGAYLYQRGAAMGSMALASVVAAAGFVSFHLWPSLGLHAEVPGMEAAPLHARQVWWALAVGSAALACGVLGFTRSPLRWVAAAVLLALPFMVGAPQLNGDPLAGFSAEAHAALEQLGTQFIWATTWVSLSFWASMGLVCGAAFQRWLRPVLEATFERSKPSASAGTAVNP